MSKKNKRSRQSTSAPGRITVPPPTPSSFGAEQVVRDFHRLLEGRSFEDIEEANVFLASLTGAGLENALKNAPALSPQEEAQDLAYRAMDAPNRKQAMSLARLALTHDPDCVDALVILAAANARSGDELIVGLEKAVAAGERSLGARYFKENKGHFWGLLETRPYMRARQQLADALIDEGRNNEAIAHLQALLDLNPNDNQGVRGILLGLYLAQGDLKGTGRLLRQYRQDCSAVFNWGRVLERVLSSDFQGAERALQQARASNHYMELYLTGKKRPPKKMPEMYSLGSEEEALICLELLSDALTAHPEALVWILKQFIAEEEAAAVEKKNQRNLGQKFLF